MNKNKKKVFRSLQKSEMFGAVLYGKIGNSLKDKKNKDTLLKMSEEEKMHSAVFGKYADAGDVTLNKFKIWLYMACAHIFGYTFVIKLMEKGEDLGIQKYKTMLDEIPEMSDILDDEEKHEQELLNMLDEERLNYVGDIVLGMNDALVELTGALAGYTLAMQNTHVIAMAGLITGVSATLSMAASGYLSSKEAGHKDAIKSSIYTGVAYLVTVALLIIPYLVLPAKSYMLALLLTLVIAITIIAGFNFYVSIAKGRGFKKNFLVMSAISLGVSVITFGIGVIVKNVLGIDL